MKSNKRKKRRRKRRRARDRKRRRDEEPRFEMTVWRGEKGVSGTGTMKARVRIDIDSLELAKGHDGLLRRAPEAVIIAGAYIVDADGARVASRGLWRMERPGEFPCTVKPLGDGPDTRFRLTPPGSLVIVAAAVEEDSGKDIQTLFGALERVDAITVWPRQSDVPAPLHVDELAGQIESWRDWRSIHMMIDGGHVGDSIADDDWIGAAALVVSATSRVRKRQRLHFVSDDGLNDWTAELCVRM